MKEYFIWIILYVVYWYISTILGNVLYDITKINWINDFARIVFPFIFLGITYAILKFKNKDTNGTNSKIVKVSENKALVSSLKIIGVFLGVFFCAIFLVNIYAIISMLLSYNY